MSAFDSGFRMGMGAFQQAIENKRQAELDARAAEKHGWEQKDRARTDKQNENIDARSTELEAMYQPAPAAGQVPETIAPPSVQSVIAAANAPQPMPAVVAQGLPSVAAASAPGGQGLALPSVQSVIASAQPASNAGQRAASAGLGTFTDLDRMRGMQRLALAKQDMSTAERLGGQIKTAEADQIFGDAVKGWSSSPERLDEVAEYVNSHPSLTMHAPDKNGMVPLSIVNADGRATLAYLNASQLGQLAGADALMRAGHVQRGLEVIQGINGSLAKVLDTKNNLTNTVAKNQNTAAYQGGQLDVHRMNAETDRNYKNGMLAVSRQRASGSGGGANGGEATSNPLEGFDHDKAYQSAIALVDKANGELGGKMDPKQRAQRIQEAYASQRDAWAAENIQRQNSRVFLSEARKAKTPAEVEAVKAKALERGYTEDEMARLDSRFASAKKSAPATPAAPVSKGAPPAARAAPAQAQPAAPSGPASQADVDAAQAQYSAAREAAQRYGMRQRKNDPAGYQSVVSSLQQAEQRKAEMERRFRETLAQQGLGAYFGGR